MTQWRARPLAGAWSLMRAPREGIRNSWCRRSHTVDSAPPPPIERCDMARHDHAKRLLLAKINRDMRITSPLFRAAAWATEKKTMTYGLYSGGSSMQVKREAIEKLLYPG